MTSNGASIVLEKIASFDNTVEFIQEHSVSVQEACYLATKALLTLSVVEAIINREDSLIGRAQEDVIRYQMICKVMQTWKEGEEE